MLGSRSAAEIGGVDLTDRHNASPVLVVGTLRGDGDVGSPSPDLRRGSDDFDTDDRRPKSMWLMV